MNRVCLAMVLHFTAMGMSGQAEFEEASSAVLPTVLTNGVAVAVADIDGDYFDDIIYVGQDGGLYVGLYRGVQRQYEEYQVDVQIGDEVWSIVAGDVDGDGTTDIIVGGASGAISYRQSLPLVFDKSRFYNYPWLPQSSNLADVDADGDLDYFICNDDGLNALLLNSGAGFFTQSDMIDFSTAPASDNSGNYSSIWTDIDGDSDLDLYIAKCRAGVTDITDPRRVNALYINNGDGTYQELAAALGVADGLQSWSVDAGDVDNDGDMDLFVTNHDGPHRLYINDGSSFSDYEYVPGRLTSFAFQGVFADMDNNGWLDIVITDGSVNNILYNEGMQFTYAPWQQGGAKPGSCVIADLNHDGYYDIWSQYISGTFTGGLGNVSTDEVWINKGGEHRFVTFTLVSDNLAVTAGAKATLTLADGSQLTREVHLGASYGQQMSSRLHFGLGQGSSSHLDVQWPSGQQVSIDLSLFEDNTHYILANDGCLTAVEDVQLTNDGILCEGSTVTLSSQMGMEVSWSGTDTMAVAIEVDDLAAYHYEYRDQAGCLRIADYTTLAQEVDLYQQVLSADVEQQLCIGESLILEAAAATDYLWSDGSTSSSLEVTTPGLYSVAVTGICGTVFESDTIAVDYTTVDAPQLVGDTVMITEPAVLISGNAATRWYDDITATMPFAIGDTIVTEPLTEDTYYYGELSEEEYHATGSVGLVDIPTISPYTNNGISAGMLFEVREQIVLQSVKVLTDTAANRRLLITGVGPDAEVLYHSAEVFIPEGESRVQVEVALMPGRYTLRTDTDYNQATLGYAAPRLARTQSSALLDYPYELGGSVSIYGSTTGNTRYLYFYDWEVDYLYTNCASTRTEVLAKVSTVSTTDPTEGLFQLYPNPAVDYVLIRSAKPVQQVVIHDVSGRVVRQLLGRGQLELGLEIDLPAGCYWVVLHGAEGELATSPLFVLK